MIQLSDKSSVFTDSVIRRMTRVCAQYDAINLSQGFPDNNPPKEVLESLAKVAFNGPHQYAVTWGAYNTRYALARKIEHFSGIKVDENTELCITCGGTEAMMAAVMATLNPGDKVAIFSPFYENYGADAILCGVTPIYVPLHEPDFTFDEKELEKAFIDGAKALILCNPSNPTGRVFTLEELSIIAKLAEKYDAFVITDEVYEHIIFAPNKHIYFAALPNMRERTVVCNSLSKTYSITGWRIGYVFSTPEVIDRVRKVHDFLTVGAAAPLQEAIVAGLNLKDDYYQGLQKEYTHKRDLFLRGLDEIGLKYFKPQGSYFVLVDISEFNYDSSLEFCYDLAHYVKVGAVPGSSFFADNNQKYIRFHFAKSEEVLHNALGNLKTLRDKLKRKA